ncbi:MAG: hypothetical protein R2850_11305 [Bacteroidia bacterium]
MNKVLTILFPLLPAVAFAQTEASNNSQRIQDSAEVKTENYDELMYMSTVYPVEFEESKSPDIISSVSHVPDTKAAVEPEALTYTMIYAIADRKGLIYVEADPDQEVKAVHVINPLGFEVLCFPYVIPSHELVRLDLSPLGPGRYTLILDGRFVSTREISINDKNLVARLR